VTKKTGIKAIAITVACLTLLAGYAPQTHAQTPQQSGVTSSKQTIGYDISYPQCNRPLPQHAAFGIVGLNGTLANNFNPCFAAEAQWAKLASGDTNMPKSSIYVHVANPGDTVPGWPTMGINSEGICAGGNTTACSYLYGESLAAADLAYLSAENASSYLMVFMDVEANYSWQTGNLSNNVAVMEGMTATFKAAGDTVGIYSDNRQWKEIAGSIPKSSDLNGLPEWVLGGNSIPTATQSCASHPFTSKVLLAQIAGSNYPIDEDLSCESTGPY